MSRPIEVLKFKTLPNEYNYSMSKLGCTRCNALFALLAPHMIREATEDNLHSIINEHILNNPSNYKNHKERERSIGNKLVKTVRMDWSSLTKIIIQFKALNLIEQSKNKRSVTDDNTYWTLTKYGDNLMMQLCSLKKNND